MSFWKSLQSMLETRHMLMMDVITTATPHPESPCRASFTSSPRAFPARLRSARYVAARLTSARFSQHDLRRRGLGLVNDWVALRNLVHVGEPKACCEKEAGLIAESQMRLALTRSATVISSPKAFAAQLRPVRYFAARLASARFAQHDLRRRGLGWVDHWIALWNLVHVGDCPFRPYSRSGH